MSKCGPHWLARLEPAVVRVPGFQKTAASQTVTRQPPLWSVLEANDSTALQNEEKKTSDQKKHLMLLVYRFELRAPSSGPELEFARCPLVTILEVC